MEVASQMANSKISTRIVDSFYDVRMQNVDDEKIMDIVGNFRRLVGATSVKNEAQVKESITLETVFLKNNYPYLSAVDVHTAMDLFVNGKLDMAIPDYVNFSPLFIGQVMNSYLRYKNKVIKELEMAAEKPLLLLMENPANKLQGIKDCIIECHAHMKEEFKERFYNNIVYDFLRKTKRLKLDVDQVSDSKKYAEKKYAEARKELIGKKKPEFVSFNQALDMNPAKVMDKKNAIRAYAIEYVLIRFFKENNIDQVVASVTGDDIELLNSATKIKKQ